jgi:hypothetical protein
MRNTLPTLKKGFIKHLRFIKLLDPNLRTLAAQHEQFRWIRDILDWLKEQGGGEAGGDR